MTAPRTYLFALMPGGKRPVVVAVGKEARWQVQYYGKNPSATGNAHRWFLVECESAEAGRKVIQEFEWASRPMRTMMLEGIAIAKEDESGPLGRILASGGTQ
jgi:hypothetical protein